MTQWNLSRLRYTVRKITGKLDPTQIPDSSNTSLPIDPINNPPGIDDYLNDFYLYDMDEQLRLLPLKSYYTFTTTPGVGTYYLPGNSTPYVGAIAPTQLYFDASPPIYVDGYQAAWYQDPDLFYRIWPELDFIQNNLAQGDGVTTSFTFTLSSTPILQGSVTIGFTPQQDATTASPFVNESFSDVDTPGAFINPANLISSLTGNSGGTIDYSLGTVTVTFVNPPPNGSTINAHYWPYVASRPRDILFYQQKFFLKPIPDNTYRIKVTAYQQPTVLLANSSGNPFLQTTGTSFSNETDLPTYNEWWQVIAYGAALKIFVEDGDHDEYAKYYPYFDQAKNLAQRRTLKQLSSQRIQTAYSDNASGCASQLPIYPTY